MVIGVAVILGVVGLQILDDSGGSSNGNGTSTSQASTSGVPGTTTTTVRPANEVRVKVYNASGVQGKAQTLTDQLRAKGYNMQTAATLSGQHQGIAVECTKGFETEAGALAFYGVGSPAAVQPYPSDPPEGASDADCLVIIGTT